MIFHYSPPGTHLFILVNILTFPRPLPPGPDHCYPPVSVVRVTPPAPVLPITEETRGELSGLQSSPLLAGSDSRLRTGERRVQQYSELTASQYNLINIQDSHSQYTQIDAQLFR